MRNLWKKLKRWYRLTFKDHYDPYFQDADGIGYAKLPSGVILRLEGKKNFRKKKKLKELKEFFK